MAKVIDMYPGKAKLPAKPARLPEGISELKKEIRQDVARVVQSVLTATMGANLRKWLTGTQVQRKLGVSAGTLRRLKAEGAISYAKIGRDIYFDPNDVDKALRRRKGVNVG
jgi:excisionase family DNA binding protein